MTQRILLTGGSGFVGKQVLRALQIQKVDITLIIRPSSRVKIKNYDGIIDIIETKNLFAESEEWWESKCKNIDTVIHLAWYAIPGKYLSSDLNIECLSGSLNLARGAAAAGIKRFIGVGTCFEYDLSDGLLSINTPLNPKTLYAASKASTYLTLSEFLSKRKIGFVWCRLFFLYGEDESGERLVPYIRNKLENNQVAELTSGKQIRDYMDVFDAAKVIVKTALNNYEGPVNVCSGVPITVRELAEKIAENYGKKDLLDFGSRSDNLFNPPKVVGIKNYK